MPLSSNLSNRLAVGLADQSAGDELTSTVNANTAALAATSHGIAALITATATSTTTDFGALKVGDKVLVFPASAGNTKFLTVATAGTLPEAAVVGTLYVVLRMRT